MRALLLVSIAVVSCKTATFTRDPRPVPTAIDPNEDFAGLAGLPCATQSQCAPESDAWLGDTCCALGDNLEVEAFHYLNETVEVAANDNWVVGCSGFGGAFAFHGNDPHTMTLRSLENPRCQRIAFGPELGEDQIAYIAHHGDSWVPSPALWTVRLHRDGSSEPVGEVNRGALFEGLAYDDGILWVAAHDGGLLSYAVDTTTGEPTYLGELQGFDNAIDVLVEGNHAYVLDDERLHVIDITQVTAPTRITTFETLDKTRDLDLVGDLLYVAEGTNGVEVIDVSDPSAPVSVDRIDLDGSAQSVKANDTLIATANWTHMSIIDPTTRERIGTERLVRSFEQDLGVAVTGDLVFVGEWGGISSLRYRPGYVAPDIWIDEEIFTVPAGTPSSVDVRIQNRGPLALTLDRVEVDSPFSTQFDVESIPPGESATLQLDYTPPAEGGVQQLAIYSNDPDDIQDPLVVQTVARSTGSIDVGDPVPAELLDFLAPGTPQAYEGDVIVLAYFALF